ncbi:MAG: Rieske 2Fe-2S domain-containing protein [Candidatus Sulfotelmatobacter sp.]|jgi:toluene monooxygenase system ferredoxin subunit
MAFQKVAKIEDVWSGEALALEMNGERVLLVNVENRIYAYADICPHQGSRLSEGTLTDKVLRCERHHWEFDVCSGSGVNPRNACLKQFPTKVDGENILIDIDDAKALRVDGEEER